MKLTLYDYLRVGHVKRWHNVNTIREQTVAEHSYMVVVITLDLLHTMRPATAAEHRYYAAVNAIFHDTPEVAIGDTPTPAKRLIREATGDPAIFEKIEKELMPEMPYGGYEVWRFDPYVKMADAIEAYHFIHDNGAGTHAQIVISGARRKMEDMVEKNHMAEPDAGWYPAVNRVLMALNLPYVHRESRISPP